MENASFRSHCFVPMPSLVILSVSTQLCISFEKDKLCVYPLKDQSDADTLEGL